MTSVGQFEPRTVPKTPESTPARPPEPGPPLGGVVGGVVTGGGVGVELPPPGAAPEDEPDEGRGVLVPLVPDPSAVAPVDDVEAVGVLDELVAPWLESEPTDVLGDVIGAGLVTGVPVGALAAELGGAGGDVVAVGGAVDGVVAGVEPVPSGLSEWDEGLTRMVWVPGNETDTGFTQPPSTAPPARATRAPAASTVVPGCRLITWTGRAPERPVRRAASSMEAPGPPSVDAGSASTDAWATLDVAVTWGDASARLAVSAKTAGSGDSSARAGSGDSSQRKEATDISGRVSVLLGSDEVGQLRVPASWVSAPRITCRDSSPGSAS